MALTLNIRGQKSWSRVLSATVPLALLFAVFLTLSSSVVGGSVTTAPRPAATQEVVAVMGHLAPCCEQPGQKTYHGGVGAHIACAFCVPIPQSFEQIAPASGSENFSQAFAMMQSRSAAPDPFPPKIMPAV